MGLLIGLSLGIGLFLLAVPGSSGRVRRSGRTGLAPLLHEAGIVGVTPAQVVAVSALLGLVVGVLTLALTSTVPLATAFAAFAALAPRAQVKRRAQRRRLDRREVWPEVVDNLASAVRAGMSLPEAVVALGKRGPAEMRVSFLAFGENYRALGSFDVCLDRLADDLADPVGDRLVESLRLARQVGGSDIGRVLRTASQFLREEARTRSELETRQGWTVNAARLALAAPWLVLLLLATQSSTVQAYNSPAGVVVMVVGGTVSYAAYLLMKRIGRLPVEPRVLR